MTGVGNMSSVYQLYGNVPAAEGFFRVGCHWKADYEKQLDSWTNEGGAVGLRSEPIAEKTMPSTSTNRATATVHE